MVRTGIMSSIDTYDRMFDNDMTELVKSMEGLDHNKSKMLSSGYKVVAKPSINGLRHCTKAETVAYDEELKRRAEESGEVTRLDIANGIIDMSLKVDYKVFRLFLESVRISRKAKKPVFSTIIGINKKGNIKFSTDSLEVTIYDNSDKYRLEEVRVEFRVKDMAEENMGKAIERGKKEVVKMLESASGVLPNVENYYIRELIKVYKDDKKNGLLMHFTDFVVKYNAELLNKRVFEGVYKEIGVNTPMNNWLRGHRRNRTLEFVTDKALNDLIKKLKKGVKSIK